MLPALLLPLPEGEGAAEGVVSAVGLWRPYEAWDFRTWGKLGFSRGLRIGFGGVCLAGVLLQTWRGGLCPGGGGCALLEGGEIRDLVSPLCLVPNDA